MKRLLSSVESLQLSSSPRYELIHPPLKHPRDIRLVKILPGSPMSAVKCELQVVSLDTSPTYNALSYCWGETPDRTWISCHGQRYDVTRSLLTALRRFRRKDIPVIFWIDQLCINQADLDERASQVGLMREIYALAEIVYVWLGPEAEDSTLAIKFLPWLSEVVRRHENLRNDCDAWHGAIRKELGGRTSKEWKALSALLRRDWFGRAWIVQEVNVASNAIVVCGKQEIQWDHLVEGASKVVHIGMSSVGAMPLTHWRLMYLVEIKNQFERDKHVPLEILLTQARFFQAKDPRDNVFAVLGLCPKGEVVAVDYSKDVCHVFRDVTAYLLFGERAKENDELIPLILRSSQAGGISGLPSWVPDWSRPFHADFRVSHDNTTKFKAGGKGSIEVAPTQDPNRIRLRGKIFDTVHQMSSIAPSPTMAELVTAFDDLGAPRDFFENLLWKRITLNCWLIDTSALAWTCTRYPDEKSKIAAYSRTLICNETDKVEDNAGNSFEHIYWQFRTCLAIMYPGGIMNGAPLESIAHAVVGYLSAFKSYEIVLQSFGSNRRLFSTMGGYMALGPANVQPHDLMCVFVGGDVPFILRPYGDEYKLIGECYVHGVMDGEVMETSTLPVQDIVLK